LVIGVLGFAFVRLWSSAATVGAEASFVQQQMLQCAASCGDVPEVRRLLAAGASATWRDDLGLDALACAATTGHAGTARLLLAAGAQVDGRDRYGYTPLLHAAMAPPDVVGGAPSDGAAEVARVLLEYGADAGAVTGNGQTVAELATLRGNVRLLRLLGGRSDVLSRAGGEELPWGTRQDKR
jgi:ankyrin repeat protein